MESLALLQVDDRIQRKKNMQEISVEDWSYEYSSGRDSVFRENYDSPDMAYTDNDFVTDPIKMIKSNLEA